MSDDALLRDIMCGLGGAAQGARVYSALDAACVKRQTKRVLRRAARALA